MKRIAIVGAGISGLTCAFRLEELKKEHGLDLEISVYEAAPRAGGTIQTETRDGFILEKGPDSFISEKPWALGLSKRLGIDSEILNTKDGNKKVFVVKKGKFIPLPEGFYLIAPTHFASFLSSSLFSFFGKLRIALEIFIPPKRSAGDESIASFIRRRFGNEALERVGQPMIAGIYSGDPERLSLSETMPQFRDLELKHGSVIRGLIERVKRREMSKKVSGPRYGLFLSYKNGMKTLIEALLAHLPAGSVHLGARVTLKPLPSGKWALTGKEGSEKHFDTVCLAVNAKVAAGLLQTMDTPLAETLRSMYFESVATLNLAYKRNDVPHKLDSFGFVVPAVEKRSLTACTFSSQKFEGRSPESHALLRAFIGGAYGKRFFDMNDRDLLSAVTADLKELLGITAAPHVYSIERHPESLPQYDLNHRTCLSEIEKRLQDHPGLHVTGSSYRGTGITNCVHDAEREAERIVSILKNDV